MVLKEIRKSCETCRHIEKLSSTEWKWSDIDIEPTKPIVYTGDFDEKELVEEAGKCLKFNATKLLSEVCDSWEAKTK